MKSDHTHYLTKFNFTQCVVHLASLKSEFSCLDVCCNGSSEHKQEAEKEIQTELLAQFLSKPSNIGPIELNLGDH